MSVLDRTHEVLNQAAAAGRLQRLRGRPRRCARRSSARAAAGASTVRATSARSPAARRRASTAGAPSATSRACVTHDRYGNRIDEVELDPSWHWLLRVAVEREIPRCRGATRSRARTWSARPVHASGRRSNAGVMCPVSMTYAAVPALREHARAGRRVGAAPDAARLRRAAPLAGMAMTEKQGGSDVRANTTRAEPAGDGTYEITGHKWFCSYPPCDVFLVLAQAPGGLSCFLVRGPRPGLPASSGSRTSSARARCRRREVEFRGLPGRLVGEEGRGVPTIIGMVNHTRLDCLLGATSGMRRAARRRPCTTRATARRSASCWPSSRRCRTCSPISRSSPRPPPPRPAASRAPTTRTTPPSGASPPRC